MLDLLYIAITVAFFAIMLGYIRGCEVLGREAVHEDDRS